MPIIKSAKKKLRKDTKRTAHNLTIKERLRGLVKQVRKTPSRNALQSVASALDKAANKKLIHPNKAARIKSRLSKAAKSSSGQTVASQKAAVKKTAPKVTAKKTRKTR